MRITHRVAWWFTLFVFAALFVFLVTSTTCMQRSRTTHYYPPKDGWLVRGSAVPWHDNPSGVCTVGHYIWYQLST